MQLDTKSATRQSVAAPPRYCFGFCNGFVARRDAAQSPPGATQLLAVRYEQASLFKRIGQHDAAKGSQNRAGYRAGEPNHHKTDGAADHGSDDDKRNSARRKGALLENFSHGTSPLPRERLVDRRVLALTYN
jgi:hypothetical protein